MTTKTTTQLHDTLKQENWILKQLLVLTTETNHKLVDLLKGSTKQTLTAAILEEHNEKASKIIDSHKDKIAQTMH